METVEKCETPWCIWVLAVLVFLFPLWKKSEKQRTKMTFSQRCGKVLKKSENFVKNQTAKRETFPQTIVKSM